MPDAAANASRLAQAQQLLALATQLQLGYPPAPPAVSPRAAGQPSAATQMQITDITESFAAADAQAASPAPPNADIYAAALLRAAGGGGAEGGVTAQNAAAASALELYTAALGHAAAAGGPSPRAAAMPSPTRMLAGGALAQQTSDLAWQANLARQTSDLARQTSLSRQTSDLALQTSLNRQTSLTGLGQQASPAGQTSGLARNSSGIASFLTAMETSFGATPGAGRDRRPHHSLHQSSGSCTKHVELKRSIGLACIACKPSP